MSVEIGLRRSGRLPSTMAGISKRLVRTKILQLIAQIEVCGVTNDTVQEVGRLLRSLKGPRIPGMSVFPELYVMSVSERHRIYKTTSDPYLDVELLGPHIGDTVFYAARLVLKGSYGLEVEDPGDYKWHIVRDGTKVGDLSYDRTNGHRVRRLRAKLKGRTIAFRYWPAGLVVKTEILFNPPSRRRQIRAEVLPTLQAGEKQFTHMLTARPHDFFGHVERILTNGLESRALRAST